MRMIDQERRGPMFHIRNFLFFVLELFFLGYPIYFCCHRKKMIRDTRNLVRDLIDIENRQLIVNYQVKVEVTKLSAFTVVQLESVGPTNILDRSMAPLVQPRQSKGRKVRIAPDLPSESI